ncbi:hypothetical protein IMSHALPRED_004745 [Imshaugia aleurites]|uniref:Major facilitator superfamily (MFS) profile domain-containing protein n=1 Tax=Imshaugia aleurites TaxID=172621 RepID=A0A8H3F767_9LECA|nr:hypothetical protein IMSHALPRED_004745 [Imshaugia aleurites]
MALGNKEQRHDSLNSPNVTQTALGPGKHEQSAQASDLGNFQDADEALQAVGNSSDAGEIDIDEELKTRLLRKIDLHIMPMMCIVYGLSHLDKTTLSYASIMGLETDLNLTKSNYQWLGSIFYIGYLGFEYPTSRLLQRLPLAKYSAFNIILWGLTLSCTAATSNFAGIASVRLLLGMFEAAVTPGFVLFTSQWYTKKEQGLRTGIWCSFNGFANVLGGLVAYGVAQGPFGRSVALAGWKIVFLVWGLITMVMGIIFLLVMPDSPLKTRFLRGSEGRLVIERTRHNQQGIGNKHFKMYQVKEAFADPQTWAFVMFALLWDIPNGGISTFFSQLIVSFGFTAEQSLLYSCPAGVIAAIAILLSGYFGDRFGQRILISSFGLLVSIVGMVLIVALPLTYKGGRLAGYYMVQVSTVSLVALLSLIASNVAGHTKKTTVAALFLIAYCAGNIIGPQIFNARESPRFRSAEITILVCWTVCVLDLGFIRWYYQKQNHKKLAVRAAAEYVKVENSQWLDLTDRENPELIYTL